MKTGIEWQVCALEYSKKLKELNVKQESLFWWYKDEIDIDEFDWRLGVIDFNINDLEEKPQLHGFGYGLDIVHGKSPFNQKEYISAFTVAELGEMLPLFVGSFAQFHIVFNRDHHGWIVNYCDPKGEIEYEEIADTEADARAKMLIYLLENKIIKPEDL